MEKFLRRVRRACSATEWCARQVRRKEGQAPGTRGLLLLQIDGLSQRQLQRALENGRMPFLQRLLRKEDYSLRSFYSGLPSTTPAVQGELFYGVCCVVPAFRFRNAKEMVSMVHPGATREIEQDVASRGEEPLLEGGASWSNIFSGGAAPEEAHFCAACGSLKDLLAMRPDTGFTGVFLFQAVTILRVALLLVLECFHAGAELVDGLRRGEPFWSELKFIISRLIIATGLREAITAGAMIDLARGLPIVHVNFLGYDEKAHRRGPSTRFAHRALKPIDRAMARLFRAAHRSGSREYEVWIFADHGQETVRSYFEERGPIECAIADGLHQLFGEDAPAAEVGASGPVGHVYLRSAEGSRPHVSPEQVQQLARWLVRERHVPGVLVRAHGGKALWIHSKGEATLPDGAPGLFPHEECIRPWLAEDLLRIVHHPFSGDLVLLGWQPHGDAWTFSLERGGHGGPGLEETLGFFCAPQQTRLPVEGTACMRPSHLRAAVLHELQRRPMERRKMLRDGPRKLRVMTYNVHHCAGMDGRVSVRRIARVLERYDPDVVALQELDVNRPRTGCDDQPRSIAAELDFELTFCPSVTLGEARYGHALLSHFPIEVTAQALLPTGPKRRREPRTAVLAKISVEGVAIYILHTHFGLGWSERAAQAAELLTENWLGRVPMEAPLIVCGDFNMRPHTAPYRKLTSRLRDAQLQCDPADPQNTFPCTYPVTRIDHVFVSDHFRVERVRVPRNELTRVASDHLPLVVDLEFRA